MEIPQDIHIAFQTFTCVPQDRVPSAEALVAFEFASREEGIRVAELWVETRNHEDQ